MSKSGKYSVMATCALYLLGCGAHPATDEQDHPTPAPEAPGARLPDDTETIYVYDQSVLRWPAAEVQRGALESAALTEPSAPGGCMENLGQMIDKAVSGIAKGGPEAGFGILLTTKDPQSLFRCIKTSYRGQEGTGGAWELTVPTYPTRVSVLDETTLLLANPRWHELIARNQRPAVTRTSQPRVVEVSQLLAQQRLLSVVTPPESADVPTDSATCRPSDAYLAVAAATNELGPAENLLAAFIAIPLMPMCAVATDHVTNAAARMDAAGAAVQGCVALVCRSGYSQLCYDYAASLRSEAKNLAVTCYIPFWHLVGAGIVLDRLQRIHAEIYGRLYVFYPGWFPSICPY